MNAIQNERLRRSMTQKRLAHEAGISPRTLRKLERGGEVSLETARAVRKALGLGDPEARQPPDVSISQADRPSPFYDRFAAGCIGLILAISVGITTAFVVLHHFDPNALLAVRSAEACGPAMEKVVEAKVEGGLPGTKVVDRSTVASTDGCWIKLTLKTSDEEAAILAELKDKGMSGEMLQYGKPGTVFIRDR